MYNYFQMNFALPKEVESVAAVLEKNGFSAYLVGGCIRDLLMKRVPKDWDIATNAKPDEVQKLFPDNVYENEFGTVGIKTRDESGGISEIGVIEVTTFRKDGCYSDVRHPDTVEFAKTIEEDLSRRDFTVNALAFNLSEKNSELVDPFGGIADLGLKTLRAVGKPAKRFSEDALRLMRAVRFSAQLDFEIEQETAKAVKEKAHLLEKIAKERVRDELQKLIMTPNAASGIRRMEELGLLQYVLTELREGINVGQNKHHIYSVFEHNVRALEYSAKQNYSLEVRLASLLHDVGKPKSKRGDGPDSTFYGHQVVGGKMAKNILSRLNFPKKVIDKVSLLVHEHMFVYDPAEVTAAGVRRLLARVGVENIDDLLRVREADRIGSGVPKAVPYNLRYLKAMIEKEKTSPISPKMMKINGNDLMSELKIEPSPRLGKIIAILLEEVIDDPKLNTKEELLEKARKLNALSDAELDELGKKAKERAAEEQEKIEEGIKKKHFVK